MAESAVGEHTRPVCCASLSGKSRHIDTEPRPSCNSTSGGAPPSQLALRRSGRAHGTATRIAMVWRSPGGVPCRARGVQHRCRDAGRRRRRHSLGEPLDARRAGVRSRNARRHPGARPRVRRRSGGVSSTASTRFSCTPVCRLPRAFAAVTVTARCAGLRHRPQSPHRAARRRHSRLLSRRDPRPRDRSRAARRGRSLSSTLRRGHRRRVRGRRGGLLSLRQSGGDSHLRVRADEILGRRFTEFVRADHRRRVFEHYRAQTDARQPRRTSSFRPLRKTAMKSGLVRTPGW